MMQFVDLQAQYQAYREPIDRAMAAVMAHGKFIMGPEVTELEHELARRVDESGQTAAIAVANGTVALEIALRALDVGPGDEVITVPFTWISTAEVIAAVGARPVFVDVEPDGFTLDVTQLGAALTERTRAIIPVSLFGQPAQMEEIQRIADAAGVVVIEDAAQSFGATRHGIASGALSKIATTSFFPAKPLGCYGDGGMVFCQDVALVEKMRAIRTHGGQRRHHHPYVGMNGRMDTLQCAVVLAKLPYYAEEVAARQRVADRYQRALENFCAVPEVLAGNTSVWAQYTVRVSQRDRVQAVLREHQVPSAVYYPTCLHQQPVFVELGCSGEFPVAERASEEVLSLPMHPFLTEHDQDRVCDALRLALMEAGA